MVERDLESALLLVRGWAPALTILVRFSTLIRHRLAHVALQTEGYV